MAASQRKEAQIAVRFTPDELDAIRQTAAQERRTVADTVRLIISDAIAARRAAQQQGQAA